MLWVIFGVPLGFLCIRYREKIINMMGTIGWAENYLGAGGSYTVMKFFGIFIVFFSVFYPLGACDAIINTILGPFS